MARFLGWPPDRVTVGKRALLVQGSWATTWHSIQVINSASARSAVAKSDDTAYLQQGVRLRDRLVHVIVGPVPLAPEGVQVGTGQWTWGSPQFDSRSHRYACAWSPRGAT